MHDYFVIQKFKKIEWINVFIKTGSRKDTIIINLNQHKIWDFAATPLKHSKPRN